MPITPDQNEFWDMVERELKMKQGGTWRSTMLLIRIGMSLVLFAAAYMLFYHLLEPPKGYFITVYERALHPVFWMIAGTLFIICGAYLRFRAMGPIVDKLKLRGPD